jgi:hypothetical protein
MTTTSVQRPFDGKKIEEQRFEFLLYINNNIICQRYFNIKDFNENNLNEGLLYGVNVKELMDNLTGMNNGQYGTMGIIPNFLKERSKDFTWGNYNPYASTQESTVRSLFEKIDDFQFEIRIDKKTVAKSMFSGNYFPPKVRYAVDIKEIIPSIIAEIRHYFSA